jgi:hypothetical protein
LTPRKIKKILIRPDIVRWRAARAQAIKNGPRWRFGKSTEQIFVHPLILRAKLQVLAVSTSGRLPAHKSQPWAQFFTVFRGFRSGKAKTA